MIDPAVLDKFCARFIADREMLDKALLGPDDLRIFAHHLEVKWRAALVQKLEKLTDALRERAMAADREADHPQCRYDRSNYVAGTSHGLRHAADEIEKLKQLLTGDARHGQEQG